MKLRVDKVAMIERLERQAEQIRKLPRQNIRIGRFFICYDVLLSSQRLGLEKEWARVKKYIALNNNDANEVGPRSAIARESLERSRNSGSGGLNWMEIYILSMLWGYGETNGRPAKDGPTKLFVSLATPDSNEIICQAAKFICDGDIKAGFELFCAGDRHLEEVGVAFGTKFLFAVGLTVPNAQVKPLVFDSRIKNSLEALGYEINALDATEYLVFCREMADIATRITVPVDKLEQFLFEANGKLERTMF